MNKQIILKWAKILVPALFLLFTIWEFQRWYSNFPDFSSYYDDLEISETQERMKETVDVYGSFGPSSSLLYFTIQTNFIVAGVVFVSWTLGIKVHRYIRAIATLDMTITFGIFWLLLAPFLPWGQRPYIDFVNVVQHFLAFLLVVWWNLSSKQEEITNKKKGLLYLMIHPFLYLILMFIVYNVSTPQVAVYPFFFFRDPFTLGLSLGLSYALSGFLIIVMIVTFSGMGWLTIKTINKIYRHQNKSVVEAE